MSNKYEKILDKQTGNNLEIEAGFQKVILTEIEWIDSDFHDVAIKVTFATENYPDLKISRIIGGDWNVNDVNRKATIWKVTNVLDTLDSVIEKDIVIEELFDTETEPPEFISDKVQEINASFNRVNLFGYLFKANTKSGKTSKLYWNIHNRFASSESAEDYIVNSFENWKNNEMVQQYWNFAKENSKNNKDTFGQNQEEQQILESAGF